MHASGLLIDVIFNCIVKYYVFDVNFRVSSGRIDNTQYAIGLVGEYAIRNTQYAIDKAGRNND